MRPDSDILILLSVVELVVHSIPHPGEYFKQVRTISVNAAMHCLQYGACVRAANRSDETHALARSLTLTHTHSHQSHNTHNS